MELKSGKLIKMLIILQSSFFISNCFSQWLQQTLPVSEPIQGIEFVDTLNGWAVAANLGDAYAGGYILNTTNGGTNWLIQLNVPVGFTDIDMINTLTGYAGGGSKLYWTTDGGINWNLINMVPNMYIGDMQFLNKDSAWECGISLGPDVRTTTDGGNTWLIRTSGINVETQKLFFLNYDTGFCGASGVLYKTANAGLNWNLLNVFSPSIRSIYFLNQNIGWVGLGLNRLYFTNNGGINWIMQTLPPNSNSSVYDLHFFNDYTGYAGTAFNKIFKTTDGGLNWGYQFDSGGSYRFSFINELRGWSGTPFWYGGISHTTNGGGEIIYIGFVNNGNHIPAQFKLYQNYPNPFNPLTTIKFDLPNSSYIIFVIYDILGEEVYKINQYLKVGTYSFTWDARKYSSGIYFYRLITENYADTKKLILVK